MLNIFRPPNKTTQEKVVGSRSDCAHEDQEFIADSGASLHMMSKSELTSGEKDTLRRSKESTVITTASGKAESTQEATVYVDDLHVFVTMMLLADSSSVLSLGLLCEEMGYSCERELPSLMKHGKMISCKSENPMPTVAV